MKRIIKILGLFTALLLSACGSSSSSQPSSQPPASSSQSSETTSSSQSSSTTSLTSSSSEDSSSSEGSSSSQGSSSIVVDPNVYDHLDWTPIGDPKAFIYEEDDIINNVFDETVQQGNTFDYATPKMNIYTTEMGSDYTISVDVEGTYTGDVNKLIFAGLVAWYQDTDNFVVVGAHWANFDRPHEIRSLFITGKVAGVQVNWVDFWTDNSGVFPKDGIQLTVDKVGKNFAFDLRGDGHAVKTGNLNINGTDTLTSKVGIIAINDAFVFTNFEVEEIIPDTSVTYTLVDGVENYQLIIDSSDNSAILKQTTDGVEKPDKEGTYVADGRNLTLTFGDETQYVKVFDNNHTFEFYTPVLPDDEALVIDGSAARAVETLKEDFGDDFVLETDFVGTISEPGHAIKVGFYPWYVDEDNYIEVYIEWSASDRSHEIRAMQITGHIAGAHVGWHDIWCDGSNKLVSDGFSFKLTKVGKTFTVELTSGTFIKTGSRTIESINLSLAYDIKAYAEGDVISFSDLEIYNDLTDDFDVIGEGDAILKDTGIVLPSGVTIISKSEIDGDYEIEFEFVGTINEAGHAIKVGFYPWYIDEDNHIDIYVEWSASERSHEIRAMQITGQIGGTHIGWHDIWCDGSNKLVSDGFNLKLSKTAKTFAVELTSGTYTKVGSREITSLDTSLDYKIGLYAIGDTITYKYS